MMKYKIMLPFTIVILVVSLVGNPFASRIEAQPTQEIAMGATTKDITQIMKLVFQLHYSKKFLTEKIMKDTIENYIINNIDPNKMYFLKEDVDKFNSYYSKIGKAYSTRIGNGKEWDFIFEIHDVFLEKYKITFETYKKILNDIQEIDKTMSITEDPDDRSFAASEEERFNLTKFYIMYNLAYKIEKEKLSLAAAKKSLLKSRTRITDKLLKQTKYDIISKFLNSFSAAIDPHTHYFPPVNYKKFSEDMNLSFEGIGARLSRHEDSGITEIIEIIKGGPADKGKQLRSGDEILYVCQENKDEFIDVVGMEIGDVVKLIKGPKGTKVILRVGRIQEKGEKELVDITIVRDKVNLKDQQAKISYESIEIEKGKSELIGVIKLPSFYSNFNGLKNGDKDAMSAGKDVKLLLEEAKKKKVAGIILNLQSNGGGSLDEAIRIVGYFMKKGPVVITKGSGSIKEDVRHDLDESLIYDGPLVVVTNKRSASASEIVAGALKDYKRAIIVGGDRTYGKGSVQQIYPLDLMVRNRSIGAIKITISKFFTAGGDSTQWNGVECDIDWPSVLDSTEIGEKTNPEALKFEKIESHVDHDSANNGAWPKLEESFVDDLKSKSQKRILESENFKKIVKDIKKYKSKNEVKTLSVSSIYEKELDINEEFQPFFDLKDLNKFTSFTRKELLKELMKIDLFKKHPMKVNDSMSDYMVSQLNQLIGKKNMSSQLPWSVTQSPNSKAKDLKKKITQYISEHPEVKSTDVGLRKLNRALLEEYYYEFKGPYQETFYIKESLNVMVDYLQGLKKAG